MNKAHQALALYRSIALSGEVESPESKRMFDEGMAELSAIALADKPEALVCGCGLKMNIGMMQRCQDLLCTEGCGYRWKRESKIHKWMLVEPRSQVEENLREALADYAHETWRGWMIYMVEKGRFNEDQSLELPEASMSRWLRQMCTPYKSLPEDQKPSDRAEADKMLAIVKEFSK